VSGYRTLKVSDETAFDLARALWIASRLNAREGINPAKPEANQAEALGRIIREWQSVSLAQVASEPDFPALCQADFRCPCGSTGLNAGGLVVHAGAVACRSCAAGAPPTR